MTQGRLDKDSLRFCSCTRMAQLFFVTLCMLALIACGGAPATDRTNSSVSRSLESTVSATGNPLVAQYTISTQVQSTVTIEFGSDLMYAFRTSPQVTPAGGGTATILVAGMKQNTLYHMRAVVSYADGTMQLDTDHTFQTGTIPQARVPKMTVTTSSGANPAPGVELASLTIGNANQLMALAVDPAGNVIWYYDYDSSLGIPQPIKLLPNGHMMMVLYLQGSPGGTVREVDLAGNVIRQFDNNDLSQKLRNAGYNLNVYSIDHDFVLLPNGHLLLLLTNTRVFTDLPGFPGDTTVLGNAIVDLDSNNNPVWAWDAFDHLDVNRHPMSFPDWTHANALVYTPDDGSLLFSLRHQSWVLKIDYQNGTGAGDILWKLGYQGDFTLRSGSDSDWFSAQHDANIASPNGVGNFQLVLFDNGNLRAPGSDGTSCAQDQQACYSAAAIFDVDETTKTASRQWYYSTPYSFWGGDARLLTNSNVFFDATAPVDLNLVGSRVVEVTQDPVPAVVWQLEIDGQNSYRTIHLGSLYPGVQW